MVDFSLLVVFGLFCWLSLCCFVGCFWVLLLIVFGLFCWLILDYFVGCSWVVLLVAFGGALGLFRGAGLDYQFVSIKKINLRNELSYGTTWTCAVKLDCLIQCGMVSSCFYIDCFCSSLRAEGRFFLVCRRFSVASVALQPHVTGISTRTPAHCSPIGLWLCAAP